MDVADGCSRGSVMGIVVPMLIKYNRGEQYGYNPISQYMSFYIIPAIYIVYIGTVNLLEFQL